MFLRYFFIFGFQQFDSDMLTSCGFHCIYPAWGLLSLLDLLVNMFHQIWEIFSYYSSNIFRIPSSLFSYSGTPITLSHRVLKCFILFSRCSSYWIISFDLFRVPWFFLLPSQMWCWVHPVNFPFLSFYSLFQFVLKKIIISTCLLRFSICSHIKTMFSFNFWTHF